MWSYILSAVGVTGLYFAGSNKWWGWCIALLNECLWIIYAVQTQQYGFIFGAIIYGLVHFRNAVSWKKES